MSYASLIVYVEADTRPEQRVRLAASLADRFSATLTGVSAVAVPPPVVAKGMVMAESMVEDIELMQARLADKGDWFRGIAGGDHRRLDWHTALDFPAEALTRAECRSCDHRTSESAGKCLQGTRSRRSNSENGSSDP